MSHAAHGLLVTCSISLVFSAGCTAPRYFGVSPPGTTPQPFPFGAFVPETFEVGNPVFSANGEEFYFTDNRSLNIYVMRREDRRWVPPKRASFSNRGRNYEPFLTLDAQHVYFVSTRAPGSPPYNGRLWYASREKDGTWRTPQLLLDLPTEKGMWFPTSPAPGVLYFGADLGDGHGDSDLYRARQADGEWHIAPLPAPLNTPDLEWDPIVSPDGRYLLFESRRPGSFGETDIYVAFREGDKWGLPRNLGAPVNTETFETAATVTPDGDYLFFTRAPKGERPRTYWVSTKLIAALKGTTQ